MIVRPNIGWLGFVVLRQYPGRTALLLGSVVLFTIVCIHEAQHTLMLVYDEPSRFPPPVMILARADQPFLTPLDACGVEAATLAVELPSLIDSRPIIRPKQANNKEVEKILKDIRDNNLLKGMKKTQKDTIHMDHDVEAAKLSRLIEKHEEEVSELREKLDQVLMDNVDFDDNYSKEVLESVDAQKQLESVNIFKWSKYKEQRRNVYVYLWGTTVFKGDEWAHFINTLPGVHLTRLDPPKVMSGTPFTSWTFRAGLIRQNSWVSWITAAVGLLWKKGGLLLPMGVVLTKPLAVTSVGSGVGVLAGSPESSEDISAFVLGIPPQHDILVELLYKMTNDSEVISALPAASEMEPDPLHELTPLTPLLTEAVKNGCGTSRVPFLYSSDCGDFTILASTETISVDMRQNWAVPPLQTVLRYSGSAADLLQPSVVRDIFDMLQLERFCPHVASEVRTNRRRNGSGL